MRTRRLELEPARTTLVVEVPETRAERVRGLLGRSGLRPASAMLFERTRSVHTFGMRFPITVAFLDAGYRVLEVRHLPPGHVAMPRPGARHVLECRGDQDIRVGDRLRRVPRAAEAWEHGTP